MKSKFISAIALSALLMSHMFGTTTKTIYAFDEVTPVIEMDEPPLVKPKTVEEAISELPVIEHEKVETEEVEEVVELTVEEQIKAYCEVYRVPYDVVLAIARLETGWFKSYAYVYGNNPGGLSVNEVPMSFSTLEEGVDAFVGNLARNYFAIGLYTPEQIGQKYCPNNPEWADMVQQLMYYV